MHKDAQRKGKSTKNASPRPRGGEGAGGAALGKERAAGGTSTTQTPAQNSPRPNGNGDKTLGEHALIANRRAMTADEHRMAGAALRADVMPNWSPNRDRPKAVVAHQTPGVAFATPEGQAAFAETIVEYEGIKPACAATGLTPAAVFLYAATHPEFRKVLNSALGANFESQVYKLDELCNKLLDMPPREMNQCANAYGRVFDYRMRIVGKLLPLIYGDQPGTQVNIQNNTGIVCNEATRERLIAINQKLLNVPTETKELEQ